MKWPTVLTVSALLCAAFITMAQSSTNVSFKSKSGDFAIENIAQQLFEGQPGSNSIDFEFSGKPLRGRSSSQNLSFTAQTAKGQIRSLSEGKMYLLSATLSGGVNLTQNPAGSSFTLKGQTLEYSESADRNSATITVPGALSITGNSKGQPIDIQAAGGQVKLAGAAGSDRTLSEARLTGKVRAMLDSLGAGGKSNKNLVETTGLTLNQLSAESRLTFPNAFTFTQSGPDANGRAQSVTLNAKGGTLSLPPQGSAGRPIRQADLDGRVRIEFKGFDKQGERVELVASGDKLQMNTEGRIVLVGNVELSGNGLDYSSQGASQTVYIQVDEQMKPVQYGAAGSPSEIKLKPGGGR